MKTNMGVGKAPRKKKKVNGGDMDRGKKKGGKRQGGNWQILRKCPEKKDWTNQN